MKIAICDDMQESIDILQSMLINYFENREEKVEVLFYLCGSDLLNVIEKIDLVFLDIEMPGMDGFMVGKEINIRNPECKIIMTTATTDRFKESFKIQAFRYITKPIDKLEVQEALSELLKQEKVITGFKKRVEYKVKQKNIQYIRAYNGYIEIITNGEKFRKDITLKEFEKNLDFKMFFRINRSELVGMKYITKINGKELSLGNYTFRISQRRQIEFEKAYMNFKLG